MSRCEHEIINKINSENVVDLLVVLQPASLPQNQSCAEVQKAIAKQIFRKCNSLLGVENAVSDSVNSQYADADAESSSEEALEPPNETDDAESSNKCEREQETINEPNSDRKETGAESDEQICL